MFVERWTPNEISFVTVPADPGAQVRNHADTFPLMIDRKPVSTFAASADENGGSRPPPRLIQQSTNSSLPPAILRGCRATALCFARYIEGNAHHEKGAYIFATVAAFVCVGLAMALFAADPSHAASLDYRAFVQPDGMHLIGANVALLGLRSKLKEITDRAEAARARITDDLDEDAVRAIEQEHAGILAEADQVRADITRMESEQRNAPTVDPSVRAAVDEGVRAERERSSTIEDLATRSGFPDLGREHVRSGTPVEQFRSLLLDHMVSNERQSPTDSRVRVDVVHDEAVTRRSAQIEALAYGLGAPTPQAGPSAAARQYMGMGLVDLAAESVNYRGRRMMNARDIDDVFTRASHSTSDFPAIFEGAVNRTLEQRYALAQPTFRRFARQRNFRDFRPDTTVKVGDFPLLKRCWKTARSSTARLVKARNRCRRSATLSH